MMALLNGCTTTNQDLDFIRGTIIENHPGIYNTQGPNFTDHLEQAYDRAKESLSQTSDVNGTKQIITDFARSFDDSHLWVSWYRNQEKTATPSYGLQAFEMNHVNDQIAWVALPTFDLNHDQQKEFQKILKKIPELRKKNILVFDLRGNQGGNSDYGIQVINALFEKRYAQQKRNEARQYTFVDWRVSQDNLSHINSLYERYQSLWIKHVAEGLKQSLDQNKRYYRELPSTESVADQTELSHPVTAQIVVMIDSGNVSVALDFIDELKMMGPTITLIGQKTKADRLYMDVRTVKLPSGLGTFSLPIKVYRNRPRRDNEPYRPDIEHQTTDREELQQFIQEKFAK
jgi:hypothetical protein